jgi:hypothetical protein
VNVLDTIGRLRAVDASALRCKKCVKLVHYKHVCQTWQGVVSSVETTTIGFGNCFGNRIASTKENYLGGCCKAKADFDEPRDELVRRFKRKVESQPHVLEEELVALVKRLRGLNVQRHVKRYRTHNPR